MQLSRLQKWSLSGLALMALLMSSCTTQEESATEDTASAATNPFFEVWNTPFASPPFGDIKIEHYMPAFEQGIKEHKAEIEAIASSEAEPTFENTLEKMELAGSALGRVSRVFFNLTGTESNEEMQALQSKISPMLTRHYNEILFNQDLFNRIEKVFETRQEAGLNAEQTRLIERTYNDYVRAGAKLDATAREELAKINERLTTLTTTFSQNQLNDTRNFIMVLEESDLDGLPQSLRDAAAAQANLRDMPGKYVITLNRSSVQPFLQYSTRRDLREKAFNGWALRGDNDNEYDNKAIVEEIVQLRVKRAQMLGYKHHSDYVLSNTMAETPDAAINLLAKVWEPAIKQAAKEKAWLEEQMKEDGVDHELEAHDWRFYAEKVRKKKYDLDQGAVAQYFELNKMLEAQFYVANQLFGLTFTERDDIPVYNEVVRVWEVKDANDKSIGLFFGDYYARSTKRTGAWMSSFRVQQKLGGEVKPLIMNNMNLNKPPEGEPTLMSHSDATTLFHEFGHALHGLLSDVNYPTLAGTNTPRDWVEFPAQIYEHFISQPSMLKKFARHNKTGEEMPDDLIKRIKDASTFNQGFASVEYIASALVDMAYHQMTEVKDIDVRAFEDEVLSKYNKPKEIIMRHRSPHFGHIFAGGYHSAYYAYMWSEILDADGFDAFLEAGDIFDKTTADKLYKWVFSKGDSLNYLDAYTKFRGRAPTTDALLRNRGFAPKKKAGTN